MVHLVHLAKDARTCRTTTYRPRLALRAGPEEIEDSLPHTAHLDARYEERAPRIASEAL